MTTVEADEIATGIKVGVRSGLDDEAAAVDTLEAGSLGRVVAQLVMREIKVTVAEREPQAAPAADEPQAAPAAGPDDDGSPPPMRYRGAWKGTAEYGIGDTISDGGQLWYCKAPTWARPPGNAWVLMHKALVRQ